jgi:hypothetical protein
MFGSRAPVLYTISAAPISVAITTSVAIASAGPSIAAVAIASTPAVASPAIAKSAPAISTPTETITPAEAKSTAVTIESGIKWIIAPIIIRSIPIIIIV